MIAQDDTSLARYCTLYCNVSLRKKTKADINVEWWKLAHELRNSSEVLARLLTWPIADLVNFWGFHI